MADLVSNNRTAAVVVGSLGAAALGAFAFYQLRQRRLAAQREALIRSTEEPLLTAVEQAVASGSRAEQPSQQPPPQQLADPLPDSDVALNLADIRARLAEAAAAAGRPEAPRLVAVSKTKPIEMLHDAYAAGQRHFGENYVQELVTKAPQMPADVRWHFIGGLQSNKAKELVKGAGPGLHMVETVDSAKLADKLHAAVAGLEPPRREPLHVLLQVNTSPWEGTKGGVLAADVPALAAHVRASCPTLRLAGLMTIGESGNAACFDALRECRDALAAQLGVPSSELTLSMGMSGDFEAATAKGSDSVRVGSSIFGARNYAAKKK